MTTESKFQQQFAKAATSELLAMAIEATGHFGRGSSRYSPLSPDLFSLLSPYGCRITERRQSIFFGHSLEEIMDLCFTAEAKEFLVSTGYNAYAFWLHVFVTVNHHQNYGISTWPIELTETRGVVEQSTPFGMVGSGDYNSYVPRLAAEAKDGFDPEKLSAAYAVDLTLRGFLLLDTSDSSNHRLIVNPLWKHLIEPTAA